MGIDIDENDAEKVETLIVAVRAVGLTAAADMFETVYFAWLRTIHAYVLGHPYVAKPEQGMTPIMGLHVVDSTLGFWAPKIPGTPTLNDEAVLQEAAADEAWHREEDRAMRREAGEDI